MMDSAREIKHDFLVTGYRFRVYQKPDISVRPGAELVVNPHLSDHPFDLLVMGFLLFGVLENVRQFYKGLNPVNSSRRI